MELTPNYQTDGPDFEAVKELFERLEFRTLVKRLPGLERDQRAKSLEPDGQEARDPAAAPSDVWKGQVDSLDAGINWTAPCWRGSPRRTRRSACSFTWRRPPGSSPPR